jgi:uncharacterized protein YjiK
MTSLLALGSGMALAVALLSACGPSWDADPAKRDASVATARGARLQEKLAAPVADNDRGKPVARWLLPPTLKEISGLALTADQRLFAHGDEKGTIWEIDYRRGVVTKTFTLGQEKTKGDFESIAISGGRFFLMTSKGILYEFVEGADSGHVEFKTTDTGLGAVCEIEGMAVEESTKQLLIICKTMYEHTLKDSLAIFHFALDGETKRGLDLPRLTVPIADVIRGNGWTHVKPSDITVDAKSGNYLVLASKDKALIELTSGGKIVSVSSLPGEHPQAEGIAVTKDGLMIISDEGGAGPATLTLYRRP